MGVRARAISGIGVDGMSTFSVIDAGVARGSPKRSISKLFSGLRGERVEKSTSRFMSAIFMSKSGSKSNVSEEKVVFASVFVLVLMSVSVII